MVNQQQQQQTNSQATQQSNQTAAALQASASALASLLPQSTKLHQITAALAQSQSNEMDFKMRHEEEPTDLSTSAERKFIKTEAADCYP